jgi:hypothetical protein
MNGPTAATRTPPWFAATWRSRRPRAGSGAGVHERAPPGAGSVAEESFLAWQAQLGAGLPRQAGHPLRHDRGPARHGHPHRGGPLTRADGGLHGRPVERQAADLRRDGRPSHDGRRLDPVLPQRPRRRGGLVGGADELRRAGRRTRWWWPTRSRSPVRGLLEVGDATGATLTRLSDLFTWELGCWEKPHGWDDKRRSVARSSCRGGRRCPAAWDRYDVVWMGVDPSPAKDDEDDALYWQATIDGWRRDFGPKPQGLGHAWRAGRPGSVRHAALAAGRREAQPAVHHRPPSGWPRDRRRRRQRPHRHDVAARRLSRLRSTPTTPDVARTSGASRWAR